MIATSLPHAQSAAEIARDVHQLLLELQDVRDKRDVQPTWLERLRAIADRGRTLALQFTASQPRISQALSGLALRLDRLRSHLAAGHAPTKRLMNNVSQHYEALANIVRGGDVELPVLKPKNYWRNIFHVGNGLMSGMLYTHWPDQKFMLLIAYSYTGSMVLLEILRRIHPKINAFLVNIVFGAIARPIEAHRINAATWYGAAIILIVHLFPPAACICAVLILGVGDPAAALIGRRYGHIKLRGRKSLEGTLGFVGVAFVVTAIFLLVTHNPAIQRVTPAATALAAMALAAVGAVAGALTEAFSDKIEDNFSIPVVVAGVCSLLL